MIEPQPIFLTSARHAIPNKKIIHLCSPMWRGEDVTYKCYDNGHDLGSHTSTKLYIYKWWECWLTRSSQRALPYKIGTFLIQTVGFQWRNHYHAASLMTQNTLEILRGSLVRTPFFLIALDHRTWVIKSSHPVRHISLVHIAKTNFLLLFKRIPEYFIRDLFQIKRDIYTKTHPRVINRDIGRS